jgi:DNA-binding CsgD family transcriptional regulator
LLARGLSNDEIAETLFVSESTVRNTLTGVYQKIGVKNGREASAWAWSNGYGRPS